MAGLVVNHLRDQLPLVADRRPASSPAGGLFVLAGATPAALGLLADISERFPTDRGAIMGLYSVFLAIGQIIGSLIGGVAADWLGIDGMFIATLVLLGVALVPLARLRAQEHKLGGPGPDGLRRPEPRRDRRAPVDARSPLARGAHGAVVAPHHLATAAGLGDPARRRLGGRRGDRHQRRPRRRRARTAAASAATRSG